MACGPPLSITWFVCRQVLSLFNQSCAHISTFPTLKPVSVLSRFFSLPPPSNCFLHFPFSHQKSISTTSALPALQPTSTRLLARENTSPPSFARTFRPPPPLNRESIVCSSREDHLDCLFLSWLVHWECWCTGSRR